MDKHHKIFCRLTGAMVALCLLCAVTLSPLFTVVGEGEIKIEGVGGDYTDNAYVAQRLDVIYSEFPVGSFFSYTGEPCTCHNKCSFVGGCDCISDYNDPEKDGKLVRLFSCQCMGFAHYCFYKIFGFVDRAQNYPETASLYYSLGSLTTSQMTVENVKKLFKDVKTGANVRAKGKHSFIVLSTDEKGMCVLQANWGTPCIVDSRYWTWEEMTARYKGYGIEYVHMPVNYPESVGEYVPPSGSQDPSVSQNKPGMYRVDASVGLRLRSGPGTDFDKLDLIPDKTLLEITQVSGEWGKTVYNGQTGWVFLSHLVSVLQVNIPQDRCYTYAGRDPDLSSMTVSQLQSDMTEKLLSSSEYTVSYSVPSEGEYTVTVTAGEMSVSFPVKILPMGDVDGDLAVTAADAMLVSWAASGGASLTSRQKEGADVDGNGTVDRTDAEWIVAYLTGKEDSLPVEGEGA